ncbi:MAG: formylglycine-generating enzyme family protein [Nitrospira sp.]|nr:formylglycine-generating enzyme family protein [Nitrospira sp.]
MNSENRTASVGPDLGRRPNAIGLYDMSGNVFEWVEDCWHGTYEQAPTDGAAWLETGNGNCQQRVIRGGSWNYEPVNLRASDRYSFTTDYRIYYLGFRLVQDIP